MTRRKRESFLYFFCYKTLFSDVERLNKEEENLKQQIQAFKAENPPLDLSPMLDVLKESPQKSPRKVSAY